ncbi:hypothetical protein [Shewanella baltica]|uniref:hypothetical protein n=1 Tax=Shewanella baltica TaxID=62322 RepID=UPI000302541C|nr:hypothetical protein [Shewanella baltica]
MTIVALQQIARHAGRHCSALLVTAAQAAGLIAQFQARKSPEEMGLIDQNCYVCRISWQYQPVIFSVTQNFEHPRIMRGSSSIKVKVI